MIVIGRETLLLGLCALTGGCSLIVDSELGSKTDAGSTGEVCTTDAQCISFQPFNCNRVCGDDGRCVDGPRAPDGTRCGMGTNMHCVGTAGCVTKECGDGFVDRTEREYCDDGNDNPDDGCNNMCTRSCVPPAPANCDDGDACNGMEVCGMVMGVCRTGPPADDGTACMAGGSPGTCQAGACVVE